ncbi:MAG: threonine--tRNA ligase [Candidatus Magasanikbacteria bacterium RIFCSPLOWO2_01_FULL_43_20b]|uniref:Threonine--tRNA ligase n=1 Tax=Candidatus Magasanikbacteria bacterium RIFCSPLOWO2_12_FULL_43_12 TaxID=1798692 RepID=A0A1F6MV82_9BACT|nr:MAG: threonine--tRNA ligase [Candidatus Magasanikbacteria bacterium RIFCSPHIGHO2_02_FULL_44_13]OGH72488.1 MAG: threonine--tRNA ligase [Candidatus Magasanikbacteria bacterium RIFCSPLOWO2_02_FULL_43_22]OGH73042.1 MAG: threonine--tRNA ligase [Candidatus Magasanikbacteria bacterium RIFCSPLOWO2_01_FULL_43_20b]OGH75511.1 MAG: threonine--tRNA ligase [Candidatus Magasanikbacteria bacterium RIFCSPLOWO2_12_FULL_43_12]
MDKQEKLLALRHSCEHVLTMAMLRLWPGKIKAAMGPATEDGFYFDFDSEIKISEADFIKIEKEMAKIIKENLPIIKDEMSAKEARKFFSSGTYKGNEYKHEWIDEIEQRGESVSVYWLGKKGGDMPKTFVDICAGPHLKSTGEIGAFKLLKIAGAYWHGDEKNKMLTRIYGTAFETKDELDKYLYMLEEAEKRDHRKLGKELELFVFSDLVGPGMPLFTFHGAIIRQEIINYIDELQKGIGYQTVHTPNMNKAELFKISGHYDKYKDDMLMVRSHYSDEEYFLKPMNCPQHTQIYASKMRSYRDLPIRIADFANLYRDERPGELNGLSRLRCFCQDDAHCFCREDQIEQEFSPVLGIIEKALRTFDMKYWVRLSLRDPKQPEKYLGGDEVWNKAEALLEGILKNKRIEYKRAEGEAAFYGPKMDIIVQDALGREWQISTIQVDFNMPVRFGLKYVNKDGTEKTPVMIHRAIIGSPERFMSILIEHYAGAFPVWLSPVQVLFAPVATKHQEGARALAEEFRGIGVRVEVDDADETVGNKVRKAAGRKIPYIIIVGDKELSGDPSASSEQEWMIRVRGEKDQVKMSKEDFVGKVLGEIRERK